MVAHDAGGAHILASLIKRKKWPATLVLEGPAKKVFEERLGRPPVTATLEEAVNETTLFLTGSGWESNLEWQAVFLGKALGIRTITFLDHWVNYRGRFTRNGTESLPTEIWVGDEFAPDLAEKEFSGQAKIVFEPNPYFLDLKEKQSSVPFRPSGRSVKILYAREPVELTQSFREVDAFKYLLDNLNLFGTRPKQITLRPHPSGSEPDDLLIELNPQLFAVGGKKQLVDEILEHDVVVGCHTMALAVAFYLGRLPISAIPPGSGFCSIPIKGIQMLSDLAQTYRS